MPVSVSASFRGSSNSLDRILIPIKVDTSGVRSTIKVDGSGLSGLIVSGNTQNFNFDNPDIVQQMYNNSDQTIQAQDKQNDFIFIAAQVVATRTKGNYVTGKTYTFDTENHAFTATTAGGTAGMVQFRQDVLKGDLNFLPSSLKVSLRVKDANADVNTSSDLAWYKPNIDNLKAFIYTGDYTALHDHSINVHGNNLKLSVDIPAPPTGSTTATASASLNPETLKTLGLKLEYNKEDPAQADAESSTSNWHDLFIYDQTSKTWSSPLTQLNADKTLWIRFAPINDHYVIDGSLPNVLDATNAYKPAKGQQTVKIAIAAVKTAIALDKTTFVAQKFNQLVASGGTAYWDAAHALPATYSGIIDKLTLQVDGDAKDLLEGDYALPDVHSFNPSAPTSAHTSDYVRYEFAVKPKGSATAPTAFRASLYDVLQDAYNKGFRSLNKDRDQSLFIRIVVPSGKVGQFELTDNAGNTYGANALVHEMSIDKLIQPVYIDTPLPTASGITGKTWNELANDPNFRPEFNKGATSTEAFLRSITYMGRNIDANDEEVYKFNVNPFDPKDILDRRTWDASCSFTYSLWVLI